MGSENSISYEIMKWKWIAIAVFITAGVAVTVKLLHDRSQRIAFEEVLREADTEISAGRYESAFEVLNRTLEKVKKRREYTAVLRRAFTVSRALDNYVIFEYFTAHALDAFPQNADMLHFAAYSALRNGNTKRALMLIPEEGGRQFENLRLFCLHEGSHNPTSHGIGILRWNSIIDTQHLEWDVFR